MITILVHIRRVCISHKHSTVADVTRGSFVCLFLLTIAAMVLTTKVNTSATCLTVTMFVVDVAERWSV